MKARGAGQYLPHHVTSPTHYLFIPTNRMGKPGQFDKLTIASLLGAFASFLATRRLFLQRSLLLVKAALTLHRYLAVTPFAQGGGSTRSCAIGIQSRIPSGWHFETASPFGIGRSLRRLIWAQHNAQTPVAAISLLRNRRGGHHYRPEVWSHWSNTLRTLANCGLCRRYDALLMKLSAGPSLARKAEKPLRSKEPFARSVLK